MSDDLEIRLRSGLVTDLAEVPDAGGMAGRVRRGVRRRRTRRAVAGALVASAAAVAVVASLSVGGSHARATGPATPAAASGTPVTVALAHDAVYTLAYDDCDHCTILSARSVASIEDGAGSWTQQFRFPVPILGLAFSDDGRDGWAWGSQVWATHDGGASWSRVPGPVPVDVYLTSEYAFGQTEAGRLLRAPIGGGAWTDLGRPAVDAGNTNQSAYVVIGDRLGIEVDDGTDETLFTSADGTDFGQPLAMPCPSDQGLGLGFASLDGATYYTCSSAPGRPDTPSNTASTVYRSVGGAAFERFGTSAGRVHLTALTADRVLTSFYGALGVMTAGGTSAADFDGAGVHGTHLLRLDEEHVLLVTDPGGLAYLSSDAGASYQPLG